MIPPKDNWTVFSNDSEKLQFMVEHNLAAPSSKFAKSLMYFGGFTNAPVICILKGYIKDFISGAVLGLSVGEMLVGLYVVGKSIAGR